MKMKNTNKLLMKKLEELYFQKYNETKSFSDKRNRDLADCISFYCKLTNREIFLTERCLRYFEEWIMPNENPAKVPLEYETDGFYKMDYFFICTDKLRQYVDDGVMRFFTFYDFLEYIGEVESFLNLKL